ncbi:hypothetical protein [Thalassobacillus hwangdonensis]|uniref:SCP2 domain-containing protein n=1 Tax=Thalassobacillus hwangdonensis TaxID=546108 RepID=A0ABW3L317_9BACI
MLMEHVKSWQSELLDKVELNSIWKGKSLTMMISDKRDTVNVCFHRNEIIINACPFPSSHKIFLRGDLDVLSDIFQGRRKLTSIPKQIIQIKGTFRDVLFVESLLLLAK